MNPSRKLTALFVASCTAVVLTACGGGDTAAVITPPPNAGASGASGASGGASSGAVTGSIAGIVGDYPVAVTKFDCSAGNSSPTTKLEPQANGSCKVSTAAIGGLQANVTFQRDLLAEGRYTLRIASDGSLELLQGTASKATVSCPATGLCSVNGAAGFTTYSIAGGSAAAGGAGVTTVIVTGSGSAKSILSGVVYAIGNVTFTGSTTNPVGSAETGILIFAAP